MCSDRFDARTPRERLLVFLGLVAGVALLFFLVFFQPALGRYQGSVAAVQQSETAINALNTQELVLIQAMATDPDADTRWLSTRAGRKRVLNVFYQYVYTTLK